MGDFTQAVELYQRALSLDPHERNVYVNLGGVYYNHNQYNLAEAAFIKGLALQPKNALLHLGLGFTYAAQKKYALAEEQLKIASAEDPDNQLAPAKLAEVEALMR
jgi:Flp pilus assembly protein TadD